MEFMSSFVNIGLTNSFHGANIFQELVEERGLYFLSFDRPGYGESDPDPQRSVKSLALDIEELADQLGLGSKFHIIGFSMGGQVAWGCLKYIPHRYLAKYMLTWSEIWNLWDCCLPMGFQERT